LITPNQIEEWLREVEARPASAPLILRQIANRLRELATRNEELLSENIALMTEKKIEDYEHRIANLEYQIELLKRNVSSVEETPVVDSFSILVYNNLGQVFRIEAPPEELVSGKLLTKIINPIPFEGNEPRLLFTGTQEELLCVFDSGRSVAMPVEAIPSIQASALDWQDAFQHELRGIEGLVFILPIAKMAMADFCIQTSRRGYVKKIMENSLETFIASGYVGTGVILPADRTCCLGFCAKEDLWLLVSQEGYNQTMEISRIPFTIEEAMRLSNIDHIVSAFSPGQKPSIIFVTQNGKVVQRETTWLEPATSFKSQGQPILSRSRRDVGVRLVSAAAVRAEDWCAVLTSDGCLSLYQIEHLFNRGSLFEVESQLEVVDFTVLVE
jgi:hypothetical protein